MIMMFSTNTMYTRMTFFCMKNMMIVTGFCIPATCFSGDMNASDSAIRLFFFL